MSLPHGGGTLTQVPPATAVAVAPPVMLVPGGVRGGGEETAAVAAVNVVEEDGAGRGCNTNSPRPPSPTRSSSSPSSSSGGGFRGDSSSSSLGGEEGNGAPALARLPTPAAVLVHKTAAAAAVPPPPPPPSREELRRRVYKAFCEIPDTDKSAYLKAMERAPELVLKESDPIRYLQRESGDAHSAAALLAAYWNQRSSLFGERSLLPMTLSGNGALSDADIAVLKGGSQVFLPSDDQGRTVLFLDDSRDNHHRARPRSKATPAATTTAAAGTTATAASSSKPPVVVVDSAAQQDARLSRYRCAFALYTQASQRERPIVMVRYSNDAPSGVAKADTAAPTTASGHSTLLPDPQQPLQQPQQNRTKYPKSKSSKKLCDMFEYMPSKLDSMICLYAPPRPQTAVEEEEGKEAHGTDGTFPSSVLATGGESPSPSSPLVVPPLPKKAAAVKESLASRGSGKISNPLFEEYRVQSAHSLKRAFWANLHNVVGGVTPEETLHHMRKHGFSKEGLPVAAGGTWAYANHETWVDARQAKELGEEKAGQQKAAALHEYAKLAALSGGTTANKNKRKNTSAMAVASSSSVASSVDKLRAAGASNATASQSKKSKHAAAASRPLEDDALPVIARLAAATSNARGVQRKDRKRKLDVIYSRNRRQREKREESVLQAQCADLKRSNAALRRGERKLMQSLADAHRAIDDHFAAEDAAAGAAGTTTTATTRAASDSQAAAIAGSHPQLVAPLVVADIPSSNSNNTPAGVSAGDLQALLQLFAQQEAAARAAVAPTPRPPPQPILAAPVPQPSSGIGTAAATTQVLLPIVQRMLTGQNLGSQDILAVIMMLVGHLQSASQHEQAAQQQQQQQRAAAAAAAAAVPNLVSGGNDALLLQLLGAVVKGEQQQQQQQQAQQQQLQRQQQKQQEEANLLSSLLAQLQGSGSTPAAQLTAPPAHRQPTSNHQTSHEALIQLLMPKDPPPAPPTQAPPARTPAAELLDVRALQRQIPKLVHRHSQSSSSGASSLSDRDSNRNASPAPIAAAAPPSTGIDGDNNNSKQFASPPAIAAHATNHPTANTAAAPVNRSNNSNTYSSSTPNPPTGSATEVNRGAGGLDILQLMLALSGGQQHSTR